MANIAHVINENWEESDNKKKRWEDRGFVSCEEQYERDHILRNFRKHFPSLTEASIKSAIEECCKTVPAPRPRPKFIECVGKRLGLS